jgi:peptide/nickel transport system substrate-binding protein
VPVIRHALSKAGGSPTGHRAVRAGVVGLVCALAAACTSGPRPASADAGPPTVGGALTFATSVEPECLDPQVDARDVDAMIDREIFDSLVEQAPDGTFKPWLATSWTISPDQRVYTFKLRDGVIFQDGTTFDAAAVKATLDHAVDPKARSYYAASLISAYSGAKEIDPHTIEIDLSRPSRPFLQALSTAYMGIQSPKSIAGNAANLCQAPVGTGPFTFGTWTKGTSITLYRNPAYAWGPPLAAHTGAARLDTLTFDFVSQDSVRLGLLTSGQAQAISEVPTQDIALVKKTDQLLSIPEPGAVDTLLLNTKSGPLADEKVRQALQHSVNLDQLVTSLYGGQGIRAWSVLSPSTPDYDASAPNSWPYDPNLANSLLDQAGWAQRDAQGYRTKNGARLTLLWPYSSSRHTEDQLIFGQGLQAAVKKVGIDLQYVSEDPGKLGTQLQTGTGIDIFEMSFVRADPDILRFYFGSDQTVEKGGGNMFRLSDPNLDRWFATEIDGSDPAAVTSSLAQAQQYINQHALALPTRAQTYLLGLSSSVHGVSWDANAYPLFYDAWLAK